MQTLRLEEVREVAQLHEPASMPLDAKAHALSITAVHLMGDSKSHRRILIALGNKLILRQIIMEGKIGTVTGQA